MKFQEDNNIGIVSISTFIQKIDMEYDSKEVGAMTDTSVFVVYYNKI